MLELRLESIDLTFFDIKMGRLVVNDFMPSKFNCQWLKRKDLELGLSIEETWE